MPVRKFHDVQEMENALWRPVGDPSLASAIARVWDFAERTCRHRFPPGFYKHHSIEEAQALRDQWEEHNFRAFWERQNVAETSEGTPPQRPTE